MRGSPVVALLLTLAVPAFAQTRVYTNRDPLTGVRAYNMIYTAEEKKKPPVPIPQSIIDGQYVHIPTYINMRLFDPIFPPPQDPIQRLPERSVYEQKYYGSFVPLTPDGPLINSAFIPQGKRRY